MYLFRVFPFQSVTYKVWQLGVLRWATVSLGAILGILFAEPLRPYLGAVALICAITTVWSGVIFFRGLGRAPGAVTKP